MQPESMSSSDEAQPAETDANVTGTYAERRKSSKPVMEKKRRARINNSLNELKSILLEARKKDSTRHSKLEKADILEMTVEYLRRIEKQRLTASLSLDPSIVDKYKAGFNECRNEVMRFLSTCEGVTVDVRTRLLDHLASCIHAIKTESSAFGDSEFGLKTSFRHNFLESDNISANPVRIQDSSLKSTDPNSDCFAPTAPKREGSQCIQRMDSGLSVVQSASTQSAAGSIVFPDGLHLPSTAINNFEAGNIALLLPARKASFLPPLPSSRSSIYNLSPEKSLLKLQVSPTGSYATSKDASSEPESVVSPIPSRVPESQVLQSHQSHSKYSVSLRRSPDNNVSSPERPCQSLYVQPTIVHPLINKISDQEIIIHPNASSQLKFGDRYYYQCPSTLQNNGQSTEPLTTNRTSQTWYVPNRSPVSEVEMQTINSKQDKMRTQESRNPHDLRSNHLLNRSRTPSPYSVGNKRTSDSENPIRQEYTNENHSLCAKRARILDLTRSDRDLYSSAPSNDSNMSQYQDRFYFVDKNIQSGFTQPAPHNHFSKNNTVPSFINSTTYSLTCRDINNNNTQRCLDGDTVTTQSITDAGGCRSISAVTKSSPWRPWSKSTEIVGNNSV